MPSTKVGKVTPAVTPDETRIKVDKFTVPGLQSILRKPPKSGRLDYADASTPGLSLRVSPSGHATWYYLRRIDGKLNRVKVGTHDELSVDGKASFTVARKRVGDIEDALAAGRHPKAEQARQRANLKESRDIDRQRIVSAAANAWRTSHMGELAATTRADYTRAVAEFESEFGEREIGSISRGEIIRHLDRIKARSSSAANRAAVVIRLLFAFARDRYDMPANPAGDVKNPARQTRRARFLDRDEIRVVWKACESVGYPWGHALRLALCTGQRIGEVGNILRRDIDSTGQFWQQTENKSAQRIDIFLAPLARAILDSCPKHGDPGPFFSASSDKDGTPRPIHSDAWSNAMKRHITPALAASADALGLPRISRPWTAHDLRRTVRTGLTGWCRVSPDNAERVLNHSIGGLRAVYDHADYRPHVAEALQQWDAELSRIISGEQSRVVRLQPKRTKAAIA